MPKRKALYSGALIQPIVPAIDGLLLLSPKAVIDRYIIGQWSAKLDLLLMHYGIRSKEVERWRKLAFCLALDHVPGMRVIYKPGKRKGAPRKWGGSRDIKLVELIEQIRRERGKGIKDAIRIAQKRKHMEGNARGLERRYYEAKRRLRPLEELRRRPLPVVHELASMRALTTPMTGLGKKANTKHLEQQLRFRVIGVASTHDKPTAKKLARNFPLRIISAGFFRTRIARISRRSPH